mmetsp:Transcript_34652/g.44207  ORF Transcript_34652/g.44207 Transcript_34652/m.44207 type:complete len:343 (+) Transcript_34652:131-1159(+)
MGDDGGLTSFFFYVMFVYPVTSWILKPGRFSKKNGLMYAIGFLCVIAAVKTGMEYVERGPNYYQILGVSRTSNPLEIKRAYKTKSLELHPDKNPSPTAEDEFNTVKQAYDVLMDMELREVYNKFGKDGVENNKRFDEYQMLIEIAIFYATWGMLSYMLTLGKSSQNARTWIFTGEIIMLIGEVSLMFQQGEMPAWFFPQLTEAEMIWLLHTLFPAFMNGCRCLGGFLYVDLDAQTRQLLVALQEQNKDVLMVLRDIQISMQNLQISGGSKGGPISTGSQAPVARATATGKLRELEERLQKTGQLGLDPAKVAAQIKESGKSNSVSNFWWILGAYVIFYYIFG